MIRLISNIFWLIIGIGVFGLIFDPGKANLGFFRVYSFVIQLYLLLFTGFLVGKGTYFNKTDSDSDRIQLSRRSSTFGTLILHGIVLILIFLVYQRFYDGLFNFNTLLIGVLAVFYFFQVINHAYPVIFLDKNAFYFDDYFVQVWPWNVIREVEVDPKKLRFHGNNKDFELTWDALEEGETIHLNEELHLAVLDGTITREKDAEILVSYIQKNVRNISATDFNAG